MQFNPTEKYARPLGGLRKPGAGQVMVPMSVKPALAVELETGLIASAQQAAYRVVGIPGALSPPGLGMIYEYDQLEKQYRRGQFTDPEYISRRTSLLAAIIDLVRGAWIDLRDFVIDAQSVISYAFGFFLDRADAVAEAIRQSLGPEEIARREASREEFRQILQYYLDTVTAVAPQMLQITKELDLAGKLSAEKVRASKADFKAANKSLLDMIIDMVKSGMDAADAAADSLAKIAKATEEAQKRALWAIGGIAVVALVGAAIYFIPRPRRR